MQAHIDKINEMASVMKKAIEVDEGRTCKDEERIKQLEVKENVLLCSTCTSNNSNTQDSSCSNKILVEYTDSVWWHMEY